MINKETQIETFDIIAGSEACNARCPFCVSKMTPDRGITLKEIEINWPRFYRACQYAKEGDVKTAMITGKGEPTLFDNHITGYLRNLRINEETLGFYIPHKEMQTNGISLMKRPDKYDPLLRCWEDLGLEMISISIVHYEAEKNRQVYLPFAKNYIDLPGLIDKLHVNNFQVRLSCILLNDYIDAVDKLRALAQFARQNEVEQLTVRPVTKPEDSRDIAVTSWIEKNQLQPNQIQEMTNFLDGRATLVRKIYYGAKIYDLDGQNICFSNCLTADCDCDKLRQLIYFPNGIITTSWTETGDNLA